MRSTQLTTLCLAVVLGGCSVMDAQYYQALVPVDAGTDTAGEGGASGDGGSSGAAGEGGNAGTAGDGGSGGAAGTAGSGGTSEPHLVDTCSRPADRANMYVVQSSNDYFEVSTEGFANSINASAGSCTPHATPGIDGFAKVVVGGIGERWHFHVRALNGANPPVQNPVVYMLDSCDVRSCSPARSLDLCGDRQDEHFTFEATRAGDWYLGIDDRNAEAGGRYELLVIRTECGNGVAGEHNEACDDGNLMGGDGCDPDCRREVPELNNLEEEFNDDWTTANALLFRAGARKTSVKGRVGAECSFDMFTFVIPQASGPTDVRVVARDRSSPANNPTCDAAGVAGVELFLWGSDGRSARNAEPAALRSGGCPELDSASDASALQLPPGRYFVSLKGDEAAVTPFNYELEVELK